MAEGKVEKTSEAMAASMREMFKYENALPIPEDAAEWIQIYGQHAWIYSGIFAISSTIASLGFKLFKRDLKTKDIEEVEDSPVLSLLKSPNEDNEGYDLIEGLVVYLEAYGTAYWEVVWETVGNIRRPIELWNVRPDRITPEPAEDGRSIKRYVYQTKKNAKKTYFEPDQIISFRYFSPSSDWLGQGSLMAAGDDISQDKQMAKWNLDFFLHGAALEGILRTDSALTPKDMKDLTAQWKNFLTGKGRKTPVLGKGLTWEPVTTNPKDIEFLDGRKENRQAILSVLGVPPVKVGLLENAKYDNYRLQAEAFHRDTILPKLRKIESVINNHLLPKFPMLEKPLRKQEEENVPDETIPDFEYYVEFDKDPILAEDQDKLTERLKIQISLGLMTPNEAREQLGLDPYPGGDVYFMDSRLVPVGSEEEEESLEGREDKVLGALDDLKEETEQALVKIKDELREELQKGK